MDRAHPAPRTYHLLITQTAGGRDQRTLYIADVSKGGSPDQRCQLLYVFGCSTTRALAPEEAGVLTPVRAQRKGLPIIGRKGVRDLGIPRPQELVGWIEVLARKKRSLI
jgi:hypothetical protein